MAQAQDFVIAKASEVASSSLKEVAAGEAKVLLVRDSAGQFSACGARCTHYGAPLANGVLARDGIVRCPWHGACFNSKTGDIEDMPGLDGIATYKVRVENDNVILSATPEELAQQRAPPKGKRAGGDDRLFLIIGGGAAGGAAVENLRKAHYTGRILIVAKEGVVPYDRPKVSKNMALKIEQIQLRSADDLKALDVEILTNTTVVELDADTQTVRLSNGQALKYDAALIATGGSPIKLNAPGAQAPNVFTLRAIAESTAVDALLPGSDLVIVGSSWIGMEVAAYAVFKAKSVTVLSRSEVPFKNVLGTQVGAAFLKLHTKNKVNFIPNASIAEVKLGADGKAVGVELTDGRVFPAGLVVAGVGVEVKSSLSFIKPSASLKLHKDGSLIVDAHLFTGANGLYAAGDVAAYPDHTGKTVRIEHWNVAQNQGMVAAFNMAGKPTKFNKAPIFWTLMFGKGLRYTGHAESYDEVIFDMEPNGLEADTLKFLAFYVKGNEVLAVASVARDPSVPRAANLFAAGRMFSVDTLKKAIAEGKVNELLASLQ